MKRIFVIMFAAGFLAGAAGTSWAQNQTGTPVHHASKRGALVNSSAKNSNMHALNNEIRLQIRQIHQDLKAGKLTPEQAKARLEKLKDIKKQELEFFRQNGQKEITASQKSQLEKMLN